MTIKRVGILYHPLKEAARQLASELERNVQARGVEAWLCSAREGERARGYMPGTGLVITIGGDGTILRAAQAIIPNPVPIVGVNLGRLGFMTELTAAEAQDRLADLLDGKGQIDERAMLDVTVTLPDGAPGPRGLCALNDAVLSREVASRLIQVEAAIDDQPLTSYKADGVIAATATGSTGYSLAAGGPILHPQARELLMLPMLAHLCSSYTMVLPATSVVRLRLTSYDQAALSVDGHIGLAVDSGAVVTVKLSANRTRFLRIHTERSFYGSLERRLKGEVV